MWIYLLFFLCRALFEYDGSVSDHSTANQALSFHFGDILHVSSAGEEEWWPARHLSPPPPNCPEVGVIPSRRRSALKTFETLPPPLFIYWKSWGGNESTSHFHLFSYLSRALVIFWILWAIESQMPKSSCLNLSRWFPLVMGDLLRKVGRCGWPIVWFKRTNWIFVKVS